MMYPACLPTSFLIMSFQTARPWSARLHAVEVRHIDFDSSARGPNISCQSRSPQLSITHGFMQTSNN